MSQPINPAYEKKTWLPYIETVLFEAQLETGPAEPQSKLLDTIDSTIRPFLFLTSAGLKYASKQQLQGKEESQKTSFASQLVFPIFRARLQAANSSVRKTEDWANKALHLLSWHSSLYVIEHPLTRISTDIQNLIHQVQIIDDIRAYQVNNRLRTGMFFSGGTICWLIGAFAAVDWMVTAGKVILIATALYYGALWVWHLSDPKIIEQKYQQIQTLGNQIHSALSYYNDNMHLPINPPDTYSPDIFQKKAYPSQEVLEKVVYKNYTQPNYPVA